MSVLLGQYSQLIKHQLTSLGLGSIGNDRPASLPLTTLLLFKGGKESQKKIEKGTMTNYLSLGYERAVNSEEKECEAWEPARIFDMCSALAA